MTEIDQINGRLNVLEMLVAELASRVFGNQDEIEDLCQRFQETIQKSALSVSIVGDEAAKVEEFRTRMSRIFAMRSV